MAVERELDERIERYLDGELSASDSSALEQELAAPEAAAALAAALFLREALREAGPAEPPAELQNRILEVLSVAPAPPPWDAAREPSGPTTRETSRAREWRWISPARYFSWSPMTK